jgi:hypothetical protein
MTTFFSEVCPISEFGRKTMKSKLILRTIAYITLIVAGLFIAATNDMTWISARFILDPVCETGTVIFPF